MPFIDLNAIEASSPMPGLNLKAPFGERIMLSHLEMEEGAEVPEHSHPHEQAGIMLSGQLELTIGDETRIMHPGEMYLIPGNVTHHAKAIGGPVVVLDIFSPIREDYARESNRLA